MDGMEENKPRDIPPENAQEEKKVGVSKKRIAAVVGLMAFGLFMLILRQAQVGGQIRSAEPDETLEMTMNRAHDIEGAQKTFLETITPVPTELPTPPPEPLPTPMARTPKKRRKKDPLQEVVLEQMIQAMGSGATRNAGSAWGQLGETPRDQGGNEAEAPAGSEGGGGERDQNNQAGKLAFLANARKERTGLHNYTREPLAAALTVQAGAIIPCVLISRIISDLPGECLGQVAENVYDSPTGRNILIPQGAKVIGRYDSDISFGQKRLLVVWNRVIYPDGSSLFLQGMQGVDASGTAGMKGEVDNHIWQMLQAAVMTSVFVAANAAVLEDDNGSSGGGTTININGDKSASQILKKTLASSIAEMGKSFFDKQLNRQPTLTLNAGLRFNVFVPRDILFAAPWIEGE